MKAKKEFLMKKEFEGKTWLESIAKAKYFLDEFYLELEGLQIIKKGDNYIAIVEYNLGIDR